MKVRLTADMIRIRLDQPDVDTLSSSGTAGFTLPLGAGTALRCTLRVDATAPSISASFADGELAVVLPTAQANRWMTSDAISLEGQVDAGDAPTHILIEKDLGCRHKDSEPGAATTQTFDHLRE